MGKYESIASEGCLTGTHKASSSHFQKLVYNNLPSPAKGSIVSIRLCGIPICRRATSSREYLGSSCAKEPST